MELAIVILANVAVLSLCCAIIIYVGHLKKNLGQQKVPDAFPAIKSSLPITLGAHFAANRSPSLRPMTTSRYDLEASCSTALPPHNFPATTSSDSHVESPPLSPMRLLPNHFGCCKRCSYDLEAQQSDLKPWFVTEFLHLSAYAS